MVKHRRILANTSPQRGADLWDAIMPAKYRGLLDAKAYNDIRRVPLGKRPPVWFDRRTQRFGLGKRGFISARTMREAVDTFRARTAALAAKVTAEAATGKLPVRLWKAQLAENLQSVATATTAAGVGGIGEVTAEHLSAAADALVVPNQRLDRFAAQMSRGEISAEEAAKRGALYPQSVVTNTYESSRQMSHDDEGFDRERNVLDPAKEHCDECEELAADGWVEIGSTPPPGDRICLWNCGCILEYAHSSEVDE